MNMLTSRHDPDDFRNIKNQLNIDCEGKELTTQGESTPTSSFHSVAVSERSLLWGPFLAIAATSFAVEVPSFFLGTPSGHDLEFHLYS